jgi:hypothetical protein
MVLNSQTEVNIVCAGDCERNNIWGRIGVYLPADVF